MSNLVFGASSPTFSTPVVKAPVFTSQTSTPATTTKPTAPVNNSSTPLFNLTNSPIGAGPAFGTANSTSSQISGGGLGSSIRGALGALGSYLGSGNSSGGGNTASATDAFSTPTPPQPTSTYNGRTGVDTTTYGTTIPKGQTSIPGSDFSGSQYQQADAVTQAGATAKANREAQASALLAQIQENNKKNALTATTDTTADALSTYDPENAKAVNDAKAQEAALESNYQALLAPTAEEQAAQAQADQLTAAEGQVNADLNQKVTEVNKEPVPLGFLQGWGTTFNKDATAKLQTIASQKVPIQQQLARLAATRQAALGVTKDRVTNAKDAVTQAYNTYDKQKDLASPYTLSAGQSRYDANGKLIASNAKAQSNYTATTIPSGVRNDVQADILAGHSLSAIINAYPDVDSSYISTLKNQLVPPKKASSTIANPFA